MFSQVKPGSIAPAMATAGLLLLALAFVFEITWPKGYATAAIGLAAVLAGNLLPANGWITGDVAPLMLQCGDLPGLLIFATGEVGWKHRLEFQPRWTAQRRANALRYHELLASTPLILPTDAPGHVWHQFVVRAPKRDELRARLRERDIETEVYYPKPLHQQTPFARGESFPHAERACREVLALPVHPHLTAAQLEYVADAIRAFY